MLDVLKRFSKTAASAAQLKGDEMSTTQMADFQATIAQLTASLSEANETITSLTASLKDVTEANSQMKSALEVAETAKQESAAQAKAAVMAARKEKLEAILGTDGAAPVLASLENADDTTFNTMYAAFTANRDVEANSKMFKEEGVTGESKAPVAEADTATRLAAKIAAQYKTEK